MQAGRKGEKGGAGEKGNSHLKMLRSERDLRQIALDARQVLQKTRRAKCFQLAQNVEQWQRDSVDYLETNMNRFLIDLSLLANEQAMVQPCGRYNPWAPDSGE